MNDIYTRDNDREAHPWMRRAVCHDSRVHFPEGTRNNRARMAEEAAAICAGCPFDVQQKCFEFAVERGEKHGVWAGISFQRDPVGNQAYPKSTLRNRRSVFIGNLSAKVRAS